MVCRDISGIIANFYFTLTGADPTQSSVITLFAHILKQVRGFPRDSAAKNPPAMQGMQETQVPSLG